MKIKLKPWDEVVRLAKERGIYDYDGCTEYVFGIDKDLLPWGGYVESKPADEDGNYFIDDGWWVKGYMVEPVTSDDVLRYGEIITDDQIYSPNIRMRLIAYNDSLYYHKMRDGEVVGFRRVGTADA